MSMIAEYDPPACTSLMSLMFWAQMVGTPSPRDPAIAAAVATAPFRTWRRVILRAPVAFFDMEASFRFVKFEPALRQCSSLAQPRTSRVATAPPLFPAVRPPTERPVATVRSAATESKSTSADHRGAARPYRPAPRNPPPLSRPRWAPPTPATEPPPSSARVERPTVGSASQFVNISYIPYVPEGPSGSPGNRVAQARRRRAHATTRPNPTMRRCSGLRTFNPELT